MKNSKRPKAFPLTVAGLVFAIVAVVHFLRYAKGWLIVINTFVIPMEWSIYGGIVTSVLALWMFICAIRK